MSDTKTPVTNDLNKLFDKIKDVRMAMLTTFDEQNNLHSRPMATIRPEADGSLLFLTDAHSAKVYELNKDSKVNLSYADPSANIYVSVSGTANAYRDAEKAAELYTEPMRAWFPKGKDDPNIMILKVTITQGEYWDTPSSVLSQAFGYARAVVTGEASKDDDVNQHAQVIVK